MADLTDILLNRSLNISVSGNGEMTILDEGVEVGKATVLNLIGNEVRAVVDGSNPGQINLLHHINFASHFNTSDGVTDAIVLGPSVHNRHISEPHGAFAIGDWNSGNIYPTVNDTILIFRTNESCLFSTTTTSIEVTVFDAQHNPIVTTTLSDINGNKSYSENNITISVTNFAADSSKYKGDVIVNVDIASILSQGGRFSVSITHHDDDGDFVKSFDNVFYDNMPLMASIDSVDVAEVSGVIKHLSGVKYYDLNSQFSVNINDIDNLNALSYPSIQVLIDGSMYGIENKELHGYDLNGWTTDFDNINCDYFSNDMFVTEPNYRYIGMNAHISAAPFDWSVLGYVSSADSPILIDTWGIQSDELSEYFTDENYRRLSTNFGTVNSLETWDSTQSLIGYDNNKQAQVIGGVLKVPNVISATVPNTNFSIYNPSGNPDYSSFNGNEFYREFIDITNSVRGSCSFIIDGFTLSDLQNSDIELWVFIPGRFTSPCYVHSHDEYNFSTFTGDNDPIRVNSSTSNTIDITFGNLGLTETYNVIQIKLVINNTSIEPSSIIVNW